MYVSLLLFVRSPYRSHTMFLSGNYFFESCNLKWFRHSPTILHHSATLQSASRVGGWQSHSFLSFEVIWCHCKVRIKWKSIHHSWNWEGGIRDEGFPAHNCCDCRDSQMGLGFRRCNAFCVGGISGSIILTLEIFIFI